MLRSCVMAFPESFRQSSTFTFCAWAEILRWRHDGQSANICQWPDHPSLTIRRMSGDLSTRLPAQTTTLHHLPENVRTCQFSERCPRSEHIPATKARRAWGISLARHCRCKALSMRGRILWSKQTGQWDSSVINTSTWLLLSLFVCFLCSVRGPNLRNFLGLC